MEREYDYIHGKMAIKMEREYDYFNRFIFQRYFWSGHHPIKKISQERPLGIAAVRFLRPDTLYIYQPIV